MLRLRALCDTKIGSLLEFSRAVHAEMDALLSAGRTGSSTIGTRLFATTYPCHYCARHIVSAGCTEVVYIEPYPKSLALTLHSDSITVQADDEKRRRGAVLFRPFAGVSPRLYERAFLKSRDLKNAETGDFAMSPHEWGTPWHLSSISYIELERKLIKLDDEDQ